MELLLLLIEARGDLVSRDQILEKIWGKDVFLDTDNSINTAIRKIRRVLKDDPEQPRFVQTVVGSRIPVHRPDHRSEPPGAEVAPAAVFSQELHWKRDSQHRILEKLDSGHGKPGEAA